LFFDRRLGFLERRRAAVLLEAVRPGGHFRVITHAAKTVVAITHAKAT